MESFTLRFAFFRHHFGYRAVLNCDQCRVISLLMTSRQEKIVFSGDRILDKF